MRVKIFTAPTEIDAYIIKGVLDSAGILAFVVSAKENMTTGQLLRGPYVRHDILVEDSAVEQALIILKEEGWISDDGNLEPKN